MESLQDNVLSRPNNNTNIDYPSAAAATDDSFCKLKNYEAWISS